MSYQNLLVTALATLWLAGCTATDRNNRITNGTIGEQVNSICFNRQINDWHPLNDRAIILRRGRSDYYRVDLIGACQVEEAFLSLQINSRGGSCLAPGDQIRFRNDRGISCSIGNIYRWNLADPMPE